MGAKFAEFPDEEKRTFANTEEMTDYAREKLPKLPRRTLAAPVPLDRLVEVSGHVATAMERLTPVLETVAKESAQWEAKRADHSASGHAAGNDAIAARGLKQVTPIYQTFADGESVGIEQAQNYTRDALRSRAMTFHKDPGISASIAADKRLRFNTMPAVRLTQATREAFAKGDLATLALIEEVIEARDGGPLALSRQQRADAAEYRADFGDREAAVIFAKLEIAAIKARLLIGLIPAREVSRARIALGLREQRLAGLEKSQAARVKAAK